MVARIAGTFLAFVDQRNMIALPFLGCAKSHQPRLCSPLPSALSSNIEYILIRMVPRALYRFSTRRAVLTAATKDLNLSLWEGSQDTLPGAQESVSLTGKSNAQRPLSFAVWCPSLLVTRFHSQQGRSLTSSTWELKAAGETEAVPTPPAIFF